MQTGSLYRAIALATLFMVSGLTQVNISSAQSEIPEDKLATVLFDFQIQKMYKGAFIQKFEKYFGPLGRNADSPFYPGVFKRIYGAMALPDTLDELSRIELGNFADGLDAYIRVELVDKESADNLFARVKDSDMVVQKIDGRSFYAVPGAERLLAHRVNDVMVEFGTELYLTQETRRLCTPKLNEVFKETPAAGIRIVMDLASESELIADTKKRLLQELDNNPMVEVIDNMSDLRICVDLDDSTLISVTMKGNSDSETDELRGVIDGLLGISKLAIKLYVKEAFPEVKYIDPELSEFFSLLSNELKAERNEDDVVIEIARPGNFDIAMMLLESGRRLDRIVSYPRPMESHSGKLLVPAGVPLFKPSAEVNHILQPLDENGDVDYFKATNQLLSKGVTPENNVLIPLLEACGVEAVAWKATDEFFQLLGVRRSEFPTENSLDWHAWVRKTDSKATAIANLEFNYATEQLWTKEEIPRLASWLELTHETRKKLKEGLAGKKLYYPRAKRSELAMLVDTSYDYLQAFDGLSKQIEIECNQKLALKDISGAISDVKAVYQIANLLREHSGTKVELLSGFRFRNTANTMAARVARMETISTPQLESLSEIVASSPPINEFAKIARDSQRFIGLEAAQKLLRYDGGMLPKANPELYNSENIVRKVNQSYDEIGEYLTGETLVERVAKARELDLIGVKGGARGAKLILGGKKGVENEFANTIVRLLKPVSSPMVKAGVRNTSTTGILELIIRIEIHKRQTGNLPASLEELQTNTLDPANGKPFKYRIENDSYRVWSIGLNEIDEDGKGSISSTRYPEDDCEIPANKTESWEAYRERMLKKRGW